MNNKRRTLIVDRQFQFHLILEALLTAFLTINVIVIAMFLMLYGTVIPAELGLLLAITIAAIELVALSLILWITRRLSNRIAGPVYRICRTLEAVALGNLNARIQLRANDHFAEQARNINTALSQIQERIETLQNIARHYRDDPRDELAQQLDEQLRKYQATSSQASIADSAAGHEGDPELSDSPPEPSKPNIHDRGFTRLEILIVFLLISIVTLIGLPLYLDHSVRTKVAEGYMTAEPIMRALTKYHRDKGSFPTDHLQAEIEAGLRPPQEYRSSHVNTIRVLPDGGIEIMFDIPALGARNLLFITPHSTGSRSINWICDHQRPNSIRPKYARKLCPET